MSARHEAARRYRAWPHLHYYAHGKIALDPAYAAAARLLAASPRPLLDLGCGMGLLAAYLRARGHRAPILGLDVDAEKTGIANQVLGGEQAEFRSGNALDFTAHAGDVVALDVLHYFSDEEQQVFLRRIAAGVAPGGVAVIRVTLNEPTWRFAATRLEEWFVRASRWIPVSGWNFPTREEVLRPFEEAGLHPEVRPMWGLTPFNSYLLSFRRAAP